jgi:hypothetical protein
MTWVADAPLPAVVMRHARVRVEMIALALTAVVTLALGGFAVTAKVARAGDVDGSLRAGRVVALADAQPAALARILSRVLPDGEASAVATELASALAARPVNSVAALAGVQVSATRVRNVPALTSARARLEQVSFLAITGNNSKRITLKRLYTILPSTFAFRTALQKPSSA